MGRAWGSATPWDRLLSTARADVNWRTSALGMAMMRAPRFAFDLDTWKDGSTPGGALPRGTDSLPPFASAVRDGFPPFVAVVAEDNTSSVCVVALDPDGAPLPATPRAGGWAGLTLWILDVWRTPAGELQTLGTTARVTNGAVGIGGSLMLTLGDWPRTWTLAPDDPRWEQSAAAMRHTAAIAIRELHLLDDQANYVVEKTDEVARSVGRRKKSCRRTRYLVVPKREAVRILRKANPANRGLREAHVRRAHWRRLQAERFGYRRGDRVKVRAHWVGEQRELVLDDVRYKVILDIDDEVPSGYGRDTTN